MPVEAPNPRKCRCVSPFPPQSARAECVHLQVYLVGALIVNKIRYFVIPNEIIVMGEPSPVRCWRAAWSTTIKTLLGPRQVSSFLENWDRTGVPERRVSLQVNSYDYRPGTTFVPEALEYLSVIVIPIYVSYLSNTRLFIGFPVAREIYGFFGQSEAQSPQYWHFPRPPDIFILVKVQGCAGPILRHIPHLTHFARQNAAGSSSFDFVGRDKVFKRGPLMSAIVS